MQRPSQKVLGALGYFIVSVLFDVGGLITKVTDQKPPFRRPSAEAVRLWIVACFDGHGGPAVVHHAGDPQLTCSFFFCVEKHVLLFCCGSSLLCGSPRCCWVILRLFSES